MKFNKSLVKVRDMASPPEWSPFFLNCKLLERCVNGLGKERAARELRSLPRGELRAPDIRVVSGDSDDEKNAATDAVPAGKPPPPAADAPPVAVVAVAAPHLVAAEADAVAEESPQELQPAVAITSLPAERAFFQLLAAELCKAAGFYDDAERDMLARFGRVEEGVRQLAAGPSDAEFPKLVLEATRRLTNDLIMLESFTVVTFSGLSKILKKHDKVSGFDTRAKFMAHHVLQQPFVKCAAVKALLQRCEALFRTAVGACARLCADDAKTEAACAAAARRVEHPSQNCPGECSGFAPPPPGRSAVPSAVSDRYWPPPPTSSSGSMTKSTFDGSSFYKNSFGSSSNCGSSGRGYYGSGRSSSAPSALYLPPPGHDSLKPSPADELLFVSALLELKESCAQGHARKAFSADAAAFPPLACASARLCAYGPPAASAYVYALPPPVPSQAPPASWAMPPPPARLRVKPQSVASALPFAAPVAKPQQPQRLPPSQPRQPHRQQQFRYPGALGDGRHSGAAPPFVEDPGPIWAWGLRSPLAVSASSSASSSTSAQHARASAAAVDTAAAVDAQAAAHAAASSTSAAGSVGEVANNPGTPPEHALWAAAAAGRGLLVPSFCAATAHSSGANKRASPPLATCAMVGDDDAGRACPQYAVPLSAAEAAAEVDAIMSRAQKRPRLAASELAMSCA